MMKDAIGTLMNTRD